MYNYMYFQPRKFSVNQSIKDESYNQVDSEAFKLNQNKPKILSMTKLLQESGNGLSLFKEK